MGSGGHNKKPATLKLVQGDTRERGSKKHKAKTKAAISVELPKTGNKPKAPDWFTEEQHKAFQELSIEVNGLNLLHEQDRGLLCALADIWVTYKAASQFINANGATFISVDKDGNEYPKKRPEFEVWFKCVSELRKTLNEFGMSPLGRCRLSVDAKEAEANDFDGF